MASEILDVSGKQLVFGLEWHTLPGVKKEAEEIIAITKESGSKHFVRSKGRGSDAIIGTPVDLTPAALNGKTYSAAQAFAGMDGVEPDAIIIWSLGNGFSWVCVTKNHQPVVGKDLLVSDESVGGLVNSEISFSDTPYKIYGNSEVYISTSEISLEDIAAYCNKEHELRKVSPFSSSIVFLAIVSMLAAGCIFYGYEYYEKMRQEEADRIAAEQAAQQDPNKVYLDALQAAKLGPIAKYSWNAVRSMIDERQMFVAGWKLERISCDLEKTKTCTYQWSIAGGNADAFLSAMGLVNPKNLMLTPAAINYELEIPDLSKIDQVSKDKKDLPEYLDYQNKLITVNQDLAEAQLNFVVKPSEPFSPAGASASGVADANLIMKSEWEINGDYWMAEYINEMDGTFVLNSIEVNIGDNETFKFRAKGIFYAKK